MASAAFSRFDCYWDLDYSRSLSLRFKHETPTETESPEWNPVRQVSSESSIACSHIFTLHPKASEYRYDMF